MHTRPQNIILAVSGSIAAYKSLELLRLLRKQQHNIIVVLSHGALSFVQPMAFLALGAKEVRSKLMDTHAEQAMSHIELARWADMLLVAPASANVLARLANGFAEDLLSTIYLATEAKTLLAPAMNSKMWQHPAVQKNLQTLKKNQTIIIPPADGELACGENGSGRLADLQTIVDTIDCHSVEPLLQGLTVLITAGPTREAIDPVRYISNHSSGKMGYALAQAAHKLGARVTLISGPVTLQAPHGITTIKVTTAEEMFAAVKKHSSKQDIFIACAAVADYRPQKTALHKIKKTTDTLALELVKTPDIVHYIARQQPRPLVIGFAAESRHLEENAAKKLHNKNLDMIIANDISQPDSGFNSDNNRVVILSGQHKVYLGTQSKTHLAFTLWQHISRLLFNKTDE